MSKTSAWTATAYIPSCMLFANLLCPAECSNSCIIQSRMEETYFSLGSEDEPRFPSYLGKQQNPLSNQSKLKIVTKFNLIPLLGKIGDVSSLLLHFATHPDRAWSMELVEISIAHQWSDLVHFNCRSFISVIETQVFSLNERLEYLCLTQGLSASLSALSHTRPLNLSHLDHKMGAVLPYMKSIHRKKAKKKEKKKKKKNKEEEEELSRSLILWSFMLSNYWSRRGCLDQVCVLSLTKNPQ